MIHNIQIRNNIHLNYLIHNHQHVLVHEILVILAYPRSLKNVTRISKWLILPRTTKGIALQAKVLIINPL